MIPGYRLLLGLCLCIGFQVALAATPSLWKEDEQRLRVGLKIFPACLGAIESLEDLRSTDGDLQVLIVYEGAYAEAEMALVSLSGIGEIRGLPLNVKAISAAELDRYRGESLGGIFVASVGLGAKRLKGWSERHRVMVFSPFAGDVELGAVAGIYVADRILPYVNLRQARRAGIRFKPFFMQVARQYE